MVEFFKINSKKVKAPTELSQSFEVLDKTERTMDGTMVVDIIGQKRKIEVSWEYMSQTDLALLVKETKSGSFVTVHYNDPETGELSSMTARARDLTYQPYYDWAKGQLIWKSVSVGFVER